MSITSNEPEGTSIRRVATEYEAALLTIAHQGCGRAGYVMHPRKMCGSCAPCLAWTALDFATGPAHVSQLEHLPKLLPKAEPSLPDITVLTWQSMDTLPPLVAGCSFQQSDQCVMLVKWYDSRRIYLAHVQYPTEHHPKAAHWVWTGGAHHGQPVQPETTILTWSLVPGLYV